MNRAWIILFIAGLCEITWAIAMDYSDGFSIWYLDAIVVVFLVISVVLLSKAIKAGLPIGTSYAVWTGIGAIGTIAVSVILGNETMDVPKLIFVMMILGGIGGLQMTSEVNDG